ncbi:MAG: hypothetical protein AAGK13_13860, partial [Pseudomonadota bacterium]
NVKYMYHKLNKKECMRVLIVKIGEPYDIREVAAQFCAASRTFYGISGIHVSQRHYRRAIRLFAT